MKIKKDLKKIIRVIRYYLSKKEKVFDNGISSYIPDSIFNSECSLYVVGYLPDKDIYRVMIQTYKQEYDV